jgi:hypothetical protein
METTIQPEIGKQYKVYRNGVYLGIATYEYDKNHNGNIFYLPENYDGKIMKHVCDPDKWEVL